VWDMRERGKPTQGGIKSEGSPLAPTSRAQNKEGGGMFRDDDARQARFREEDR